MRRQLFAMSSGGNVPNSLGPFTHERVVVGGSVSQLMTETTPQYISVHAFGHRNASLAKYAQCGTFPASGEGRSLVQECVLCAHLETRRGDSIPAVFTQFYDPGGEGGAAIFAFFFSFFFFCLGMGMMAWSCGATVLLASIGSCLAATLESIHWSNSNTK